MPFFVSSAGNGNTRELDMEKKSSFHILEELLAVDRKAPAPLLPSKKPSKAPTETTIPEAIPEATTTSASS